MEKQLQVQGERVISSEGYNTGDWVLLDYGNMVVHVMSPKSREFYDLERLWRQAQVVEIPPPAV